MPRLKPNPLRLLGPAMMAGVAYLDPGNVATNLTAGSSFGYQLLWVIIAANAAASLVQYLSAKLGIVTGKSLPVLIGERFKSSGARLAFWVQAELVAMATDLAEVLGGALALQLLFNLPLFVGGVITSTIALIIVRPKSQQGMLSFQTIIIFLVATTCVGFVAGLFINAPDGNKFLGGLVPQITSSHALLIAVGIFGATIMPHAIYSHSALTRDRFGSNKTKTPTKTLLTATRWDVGIAMAVAGAVNLAILLVGAINLVGVSHLNTINEAYGIFINTLGPAIAVTFAVGLLASGLASTAIGGYAGGEIIKGLIRVKINPVVSRAISLAPSLVVLAFANDASWTLVMSQVVLSFGIPFALFPLIQLTSKASVMGEFKNRISTTVLATIIAVIVTSLNLVFLALIISGRV